MGDDLTSIETIEQEKGKKRKKKKKGYGAMGDIAGMPVLMACGDSVVDEDIYEDPRKTFKIIFYSFNNLF